MNKNNPFLIAGGGIGGLALARMLALNGFESIVFEQAQVFGEIGAGIQLGPNVLRMFDHLEVSQAMRQIAFFPENIVMMDSVSGEEVTRIPLGEKFESYFVHSYNFICKDKKNIIATCDYQQKITAVVGKENIIGTQFHPEKSQKIGLEILKNFVSWNF